MLIDRISDEWVTIGLIPAIDYTGVLRLPALTDEQIQAIDKTIAHVEVLNTYKEGTEDESDS